MKRIISILILFIIVACNQTENDIIERINSLEKDFDSFVKFAIIDQTLIKNIGKLVDVNKLDLKTQKSLNSLGLKNVRYIVLSDACCNEINEIEIIFNGNCHLEYNPCGNSNIKPGEYLQEGFIESWGLNVRWILWRNNDFIG